MATTPPSSRPNEFPPVRIKDSDGADDDDIPIITTSVTFNSLTSLNSKRNNNNNKNNNKSKSQTASPCQCTNISIMQLFHEMKQEFPKVPDHVVTQCVSENCHNRDACIDSLQKENQKLLYNQVYPAQSLHQNSTPPGLVRSLQNRNNKSGHQQQSINSENIVNNSSDTNTSDMSQSLNCSDSNQVSSNSSSSLDSSPVVVAVNKNPSPPVPPQRPSTLQFLPPHNPTGSFFRSALPNRPTRHAPPPPTPHNQQQSSSSSSSSAATSPTVNTTATTYHHDVQSQPPIQPPPPSSHQNNTDAFVSVNVTVSPVSGRPPPRPPRHTTALNIQPESPRLFRDFPSNRSYTSVHFDVRPLSDTPQSPINITAGPSLTYSSSSFDARQGHQNQLQVTIASGCGSVSAGRVRPRGNFGQSQSSSPMSNESEDNLSMMRARVPPVEMDNLAAVVKNQRPVTEAEIVHKQLLRKDRLDGELKKDKSRLEEINREIQALKIPLPAGGVSQLEEDIKRLQCECQRMSAEVETAGNGNFVLGETNEAFYQNIYTGQRLPIQLRPIRPARPPPPAPFHSSISHQSGISSNPTASTQQSPSTTAPSALRSISYPGGHVPAIQQQQHNNNLMHYNNNNNNNNTTTTNHNFNNFNNNNLNFSHNNDNYTTTPWTCSLCTFQNHPLLNLCEQCDNTKTDTMNTPMGTDIHIHLSSPGQNTVIHSWVVS